MKKVLIYTGLILSVAYLTYLGCSVTGAGESWTQSGNDIYYTGGNVGIGTTSPESLLHVSDGSVKISDSTGDVNLYFESAGASKFRIHAEQSNSMLSIEEGDSGVELLTILGTGNVGINTEIPQGTLDVNGSIYQSGGVLHADYVFEPDYKLESITEHADFMWKNKHLKAIPKANVDENGVETIEIGAHRKGIVEELEKAHIYIAQLEERISRLEELLNERQ